MPAPKCKICKKELDKKTAYKVVVNGKNYYYCSEEEYTSYLKDKETRDNIIKEMLCIIRTVTSNYLWSQINATISYLNQSYTLEQILNYLESDYEDLADIMESKDFKNNANMIKYYLAVIKGRIVDYYNNNPVVEERVPVEVDFYMAPPKFKKIRIKRTMKEIEQLGDDD